MSAVVNSTAELNCTSECTPNVSWSYISPSSSGVPISNHAILESPCAEDKRCHVKVIKGHSQLVIEEVHINDSGTYLCSSGSVKRTDYCEMSFSFNGTYFKHNVYFFYFIMYLG